MNKKYYRSHIAKLIAVNPAHVTITRSYEIPDGYSGMQKEDYETTATVSFYERKARREVVTEYGKSYVGVQVTKILTTHDTDIMEKDIIEHDDKKYRVIFVNNYLDICKQAELDVIA